MALALENDEDSEILVRSDKERGWLVHFFINTQNPRDRKSLFKKYGDLDTTLNQLEMFITNSQFSNLRNNVGT